MKRPMNKASKRNACIAIATSAALCVSPALSYADSADSIDESSEPIASAPAESETPSLEPESSTPAGSTDESASPAANLTSPAPASTDATDSNQTHSIQHLWTFIDNDTGDTLFQTVLSDSMSADLLFTIIDEKFPGYTWIKTDGATNPRPYDAKYDIYIAAPVKAPTGKQLTYNETEQQGVEDGVGYTLEGHKATAPGTYTATATLKNKYAWEDGSKEPKRITWSIAKAIATEPEANNGLVYSGSEQTGVDEGAGYTLEGNKATVPGTYTATATLKDGYKWADGSEEPIEIIWSIDYATAVKPAANAGLVYNGSEQTGINESAGYTLSGDCKATEIGTYTATATLNEYYVWEDATTDPVDVEWTIAPIASIETPTGKHLIYNGKLQRGVEAGKGYTLSGTLEATEVGMYTAIAMLDKGYTWADSSTDPVKVAWSISPEKPLAKTGDEAPIAGISLMALLGAAGAALGFSKRKRDC